MPINNNNHKSSDYLYLERLQFRPELRKNWLNFFVTKFRVVLLMIVLLTAWGVYSFVALPLESNPEVKIPIAVVITAYPGASPADVEELVTKKVETKIAGLKDIDTITSNSANSLSLVTVEFNAKANLDDSLRKLRDAVNNLKTDLPTEAGEPFVQEISVDDTPIFTASLFGPFDGLTLRSMAEDIQSELEKIQGVREVRISGGDTSEIEIAYDPQKLINYNLSSTQANLIVQGANVAFPAGTFIGKEYVYPIRADARFFDAKKLGETPLVHTDQGAIVYLKDIAKVEQKAIERTVYSRFSSLGSVPQNAVTISIIKKTGGSIVATGDEAKATIEKILKIMPAGLNYGLSLDTSDQIRNDFNGLKRDFSITLGLVFIILFLVVGLKEAIIAGLAVPLVFFATFGLMLVTGVTLNFLSMFSLILALGLLVDDAIVVVSATKQYMNTGKFTPEEAVLLVLNDFKIVLATTTLTTIWAFLPLLLSSGIMGEYLKSIPITVSFTLASSLAIALMINHPLAAVLERTRLTKKFFWLIFVLLFIGGLSLILTQNYYFYGLSFAAFVILTLLVKWYARGGRENLEKNGVLMEKEWRDDEFIKQKLKAKTADGQGFWTRVLSHGVIPFNKIVGVYAKYLEKFMATRATRVKVLAIVGILFLGAVAMPVSGLLKSEFFPTSDFEFLWVNVTAPSGLKLDGTDGIVRKIEAKLLKYPEISNFSTIVGSAGSGDSFFSSVGTPSHRAQITIKLVKSDERRKKSYELAQVFRADLSEIKEADVTVDLPSAGPPSGADFEARIVGDDLQVLDRIAHDLEPILASIKGVINADISLKSSPAEYTFTLNPARLELYNLNAAYVGSVLRLAISGADVTKILKDGKEIKVVARFDKEKLKNIEALENLQILNLRNQPVFLKDVAKIELKPSVESITRRDQQRMVLLSSSVESGILPAQVQQTFQDEVVKNYKLPDNYSILYGGQNESNTESVNSVIRAMLVAVLLIISTLIVQFNSFKKAVIVLVTIPLALIGVFYGLSLLRLTLSFPGLIGIVALFGIVVKNAIILIDKINLNLRSGIPFKDGIIDAGKSRLEAIFLTSICTMVGIIPITLSNETWMALGGAIIFGLMLSSFLTLFVVPILFMTLVKPDERV